MSLAFARLTRSFAMYAGIFVAMLVVIVIGLYIWIAHGVRTVLRLRQPKTDGGTRPDDP